MHLVPYPCQEDPIWVLPLYLLNLVGLCLSLVDGMLHLQPGLYPSANLLVDQGVILTLILSAILAKAKSR